MDIAGIFDVKRIGVGESAGTLRKLATDLALFFIVLMPFSNVVVSLGLAHHGTN